MIVRREVAVGIDVGSTNTVLGFVDGQGTCLAESSVPTHAEEDACSLAARLTLKIREMYDPLS
jgi:glucokinase